MTLPRRTGLRRSGRLRPRSAKRARQEATYRATVRELLTRRPWCAAGWQLDADGVAGICTGRATQAHHRAGRDGDRLTDPDDLVPVCADCHRWIHAHPADAYRLGLLVRRNT